jgi:hypothetical protein
MSTTIPDDVTRLISAALGCIRASQCDMWPPNTNLDAAEQALTQALATLPAANEDERAAVEFFLLNPSAALMALDRLLAAGMRTPPVP